MAKLKDELAEMRDSIDEQRKEIQRVMEEHELGDDGAFGALHNVKVGLDIVVMHQMPRYLDFLDFLEQDTVLQIQRLANERDQCKRELEALKKIPAGPAEVDALRKECTQRAVTIQNLQNETSRLIDRLTLVKDEFQAFKAAVSKQVAKARAVKPRTNSRRKVKRK